MGQNEKEIWLLKNNPGELLSSYQDLIKVIVSKYRRSGYVPSSDIEDLIQEINRKLLERISKIQKQYNSKSLLRTYFSVIIRNICLEEFRKSPRLEEPQAPDYHKLEQGEMPVDVFLIKQEYDRFSKVIRLMFKDSLRFVIMLRYLFDLEITSAHILNLFPVSDVKVTEKACRQLLASINMTKKDKFEQLSTVLTILEDHYTSPDSLRKWFVSRSIYCLEMMNGKPPRSAYTLETLQILMESHENSKND